MLKDKLKLFEGFNFELLNSPDFKEDSVREELILPILNKLGYTRSSSNRIISAKKLIHPFIQIGSKKRKIQQFPDYLLEVDGLYAWVLDAKGPHEEIKSGDHIEQVFSYAIHPEVKVRFFALCNGHEFVVFRIDEGKPVLNFNLSEIDKYWDKFQKLLGPAAFAKNVTTFSETTEVTSTKEFDYLSRPLLKEIKVFKQSVKRHFGVHGYFTKQAWNIVNEYIRNFTQPADLVLDSFGGSGVTAIEALMLGRRAIHIDLNPLSIFIVKSLAAPVNIPNLAREFECIKKEFEKHRPQTKTEISHVLKKYSYPKGIRLSKDADVETIEKLFSEKQLAQLAYLKHLIKGIKNKNIQDSLMLAFSSTITKINLTYHPSKTRGENAGDSAAFRYYRYRIATGNIDLDVMEAFTTKVKKVINAKIEIQPLINEDTIKNLEAYRGDASHLDKIKNESIDYIYTDPPYGSKIAYLDLSVMWNAWLDLPVTEEDFKAEAIEGGSRDQTREIYSHLLIQSIQEMYRVLKFNRWMSFVFAHKDPYYWHLIVNAAEKVGFEYAGAVKQANGQTSFKKRQHSFTVLSGQLIINFKKVPTPKSILKAHLGSDVGALVMETIEGTIAKNHGATLEEINDALVLQGLELGFLDVLSKEYSDLTPILKDNFEYSHDSKKYFIQEERQFKTHVPIKLRIIYYLLSYLRREERENNLPTFDEIVLNLLPLLKNGDTPEKQTILAALKEIADKTGDGKWKLKTDNNQKSLF